MKPSRYRGFAVLDRRGSLLWGTIKRSEIEAQEAHNRFNPDATGEGMGEAVVPIEIKLTKPMRKYILRKFARTPNLE